MSGKTNHRMGRRLRHNPQRCLDPFNCPRCQSAPGAEWIFKLMMVLLIVFILGFFRYIWAFTAFMTRYSAELGWDLEGVPSGQPSWGQYSPYFPAGEYAQPGHCKVTQVNILERHGARFPTTGAGDAIQSAVSKLQAVQFSNPKLAFIQNYTYDLGTEDLVPFGALQASSSGELHFKRYKHLVSEDQLPFVRSDSLERVVLTATNWTAGFASASDQAYKPALSVILDSSGNDTLDDGMCPSVGNSSAQINIWKSKFAPGIRQRLSSFAENPNSLNLTDADIPHLISLCAFDSVAKQKFSPWCQVFTQDEFESFEYHGDLDKFYGNGYGQPLGRVQGVGYVNELLARLTNMPVNDSTQTNRTLDSSPATFPLNRTFYADFSHDNQIIAIYSALGLFSVPPLDPASKEGNKEWVVRKMVPFSARMVVERLSCSSSAHGGKDGEYVRVLVNDKMMPLDFCGGVDGICELSRFVESQEYARSGGHGDFERCFD